MIRLTKEELRALAATDPDAFVEVREQTHFLRGTNAAAAMALVESGEISCVAMSEHAYKNMTLGLLYAAATAREFASQQNPRDRGPMERLAWVLEASRLVGPRPMKPSILNERPTPENHPRWDAAKTEYMRAIEAWNERAEPAMEAEAASS